MNRHVFLQFLLASSPQASSSIRPLPGYSALLFQDGGRQSKTKVTAPPTVPSKRAEELIGDEAKFVFVFDMVSVKMFLVLLTRVSV